MNLPKAAQRVLWEISDSETPLDRTERQLRIRCADRYTPKDINMGIAWLTRHGLTVKELRPAVQGRPDLGMPVALTEAGVALRDALLARRVQTELRDMAANETQP